MAPPPPLRPRQFKSRSNNTYSQVKEEKFSLVHSGFIFDRGKLPSRSWGGVVPLWAVQNCASSTRLDWLNFTFQGGTLGPLQKLTAAFSHSNTFGWKTVILRASVRSTTRVATFSRPLRRSFHVPVTRHAAVCQTSLMYQINNLCARQEDSTPPQKNMASCCRNFHACCRNFHAICLHFSESWEAKNEQKVSKFKTEYKILDLMFSTRINPQKSPLVVILTLV